MMARRDWLVGVLVAACLFLFAANYFFAHPASDGPSQVQVDSDGNATTADSHALCDNSFKMTALVDSLYSFCTVRI